MHGLPKDTDVSFIEGREVTQIAIGVFQTAIHFDGGVTITIEAPCVVDGVACAQATDAGRLLLSFLGRTVVAAIPVAERHLDLRFDDDRVVRTEPVAVADDDPLPGFARKDQHSYP